MKTNAGTLVILTITYSLVCGFFNNCRAGSAGSKCKDGYMFLSDNVKASYVWQATQRRFIFGKDTLELPDCHAFPGKMVFTKDSAHLFIRDSATGTLRCNYKIVRFKDSIPFFLLKGVFIKVSINSKQKKHFDAFKNKVFQSVKDTTLGPAIWFELNSIEAAMKNNDGISYTLGLRHLTEIWAKTNFKESEGLK